jgi:hypothetical protein
MTWNSSLGSSHLTIDQVSMEKLEAAVRQQLAFFLLVLLQYITEQNF